MALALISDVQDGPAGPVLRVDTGTNPYYRWRVGAERTGANGELEGVTYESPVRRRTGGGAFQTAFDLPLDAARIDRISRYVQVVSYKDPDGRSPAWSAVVPVHGVHGVGRPPDEVLAMSAERAGAALLPARSVAFSATEQHLSGALFWGELLSMVDALAPLGNRVLELVGSDDAGERVAELMKLLRPVVAGLITHAGAPPPQAPPAQPPPPGAARAPVPAASAMDFGAISGPMLIGLLTAIGPTVLKAITPLLENAAEMFQAYVDQPVKLFNAVAESNRQDELLANQRVQEMLRHGDQQLLLTLLRDVGRAPQPQAAMSVSASLGGRARFAKPVRSRAGIRTRPRVRALSEGPQLRVDPRVEAALLAPDPVPGQAGGGSLYAAGRSIALRLQLRTALQAPDRPIPHTVAHVRIRNAATAVTLLERRVELPPVWLNQPVEITLDAAATASLPKGVDLTVSADVTWTGRDGAAYTTPSRATQQMCLVGGHVVLGVGARRATGLVLGDPGRHRPYWHQVWEGGSSAHRRWELTVTARYYYRLTGAAPSNGRMDTRFRVVADRSRDTGTTVEWGGYLKSGMELAVGELNKLLPEAGLSPWTGSELEALGSDTVARLTARQATTEVHLRGRGKERGSVWVFPELEEVEIDLHRVTSVAPDGAVSGTEGRTAPFLLPVAAVFVGMTTTED